MADNITVKDGLGSSQTIRMTDDGSGKYIGNVRLTDATGTNYTPSLDAVGRAGYMFITNGTQTLPSMDAAARKGFVQITDGTNSITVKASATGALSTDTALVVRPLMPTDGTNTQPAGDAVARSVFSQLSDATTGPVFVTPASTAALATNKALVVRPMCATDGTNTTPAGDAVARSVFSQICDGTTGPVAVKATTTAALTTDKALVVVLSPNNNALLNGDGSATGGTLGSKSVLAGAQYLAWASLPVATTGQQASLQMDIAGNQKVCVVPRGTVLYATAASSATTTSTLTLTIPAGKMGYLDGFDIDGLGATAGSAIAVTITGLAGGTLTYDIGITAGATVPVQVSKRFNPPLQCSTIATNIVIAVPGFGTGNTAYSVNTYGGYI